MKEINYQEIIDRKRSLAIQCLQDNKAQNLEVIDVKDKGSIADYFIIASGLSRPHVYSLSEKVIKSIRSEFNSLISVEGTIDCNWVLLDIGSILVHIFQEEARQYYQLEKMWNY